MLPSFLLLFGASACAPYPKEIEREWLIGQFTRPKMAFTLRVSVWNETGIDIKIHSDSVDPVADLRNKLGQLREDVQKDPTNVDSLIELAGATKASGLDRESDRHLQEAIRIQKAKHEANPKDAKIAFRYARVHQECRQFEAWQKTSEHLVKQFPQDKALLWEATVACFHASWDAGLDGVLSPEEKLRTDLALQLLLSGKVRPAKTNLIKMNELFAEANKYFQSYLQLPLNATEQIQAKLFLSFVDARHQIIAEAIEKGIDPKNAARYFSYLTYLPNPEGMKHLEAYSKLEPENHYIVFARMMAEMSLNIFDIQEKHPDQCVYCHTMPYFSSSAFQEKMQQMVAWSQDTKTEKGLECLLVRCVMSLMQQTSLIDLEEQLIAATKSFPKREEPWILLSLAIYNVIDKNQMDKYEKWKAKLKEFESISLQHVQTVRLYMSWAGCWRAFKEPEKAEALLRPAFLLDPESLELTTAMGVTITEQRNPARYAEAEEQFARATKWLEKANTPENWAMVYENSAIIHALRQNYEMPIEAQKFFKLYNLPSAKIDGIAAWCLTKMPEPAPLMVIPQRQQILPISTSQPEMKIPQTELEKSKPSPLERITK